MLFSQTAEYALRAVVALADDEQRSMTTQQMADRTRVPVHYLSKVLQALRRGGIVDSTRGLGGGFTLTRSVTAITVLDVVNAVDPIKRIDTCPLGLEAHGKRLCALHRKLDNAIGMIETALSESSIADILAEPSRNVPLCDVTDLTVKRTGRR